MIYKDRLKRFLSDADFSDGDTSDIWNSLRKDFQVSNSSLRGYGLCSFSNYRISIFRRVSKFVIKPFVFFRYFFLKVISVVNLFLSFFILGDKRAANKYGYSKYDVSFYNSNDLIEFENRFRQFNIGFSHNTFKSFSYLKRLEQSIDLDSELSVFEIGAGVFNFGHLLSLKLSSFEYIICDLPEMISTAFKEINDNYIPNCGGNYDVFLPTELDEFSRSTSKRKVLFITPDQMMSGSLGQIKRFDLFVNHESFSEMKISVVNNYLDHLSVLMKKDSLVFLVNRLTRPQAKSYDQFKSLDLTHITSFVDYKLDFCSVVVKELDSFRASIPDQQTNPNIFFIGKVLD